MIVNVQYEIHTHLILIGHIDLLPRMFERVVLPAAYTKDNEVKIFRLHVA